MGTYVSDSFTDTDGTNLTAHTGEVGATWAKATYSSNGDIACDSGRAYKTTSTAFNVTYYASGSPASGDYVITCDFHVFSVANSTGLVGRLDIAAENLYGVSYNFLTGNQWDLYVDVAGARTILGSYAETLNTGDDRHAMLIFKGSTIEFWLDGVKRISVTDSTFSAAGKAGLQMSGARGPTAGISVDNFTVTDLMPPGKPTMWLNQAIQRASNF